MEIARAKSCICLGEKKGGFALSHDAVSRRYSTVLSRAPRAAPAERLLHRRA